MKKVLLLLLTVFVFASMNAQVQRLHVRDHCLSNELGQPVQLRGVSMGWHMRYFKYFNESVVNELTNNWGADIVRCSIGTHLDGKGFEVDPDLGFQCVDSIVEAVKKYNKYVLVDFHSHPNCLDSAKKFFERISKKYGNCPNIIYELWNEPVEVEWSEVKSYSETLIPIIRKNAPDAVIVVGCPHWDQDIDKVAEDPITDFDNIIYSVHFYSATHKQDLRDKVQNALDKGIPVMLSECASMLCTGDGVIDPLEWDKWIELADKYNLSWVAWSLSDKIETCSMLTLGTPADARQWKEDNLKPWAVLVKHYLKINRK